MRLEPSMPTDSGRLWPRLLWATEAQLSVVAAYPGPRRTCQPDQGRGYWPKAWGPTKPEGSEVTVPRFYALPVVLSTD